MSWHTQALTLQGEFVQGGMLTGQVEPGDRVEVAGESLRVSEQGVFIIGFGRDAPIESSIRVSRRGKELETRTIKIARRDYDIQRIDNLPKSKVTPPKRDWQRIKRESAMVKEARSLDEPRTDFLDGFIWPVEGRISGVYGSQRILNGAPRRPHYGIDVAAPVGTRVIAPAAGLVTLVHPDMFFSGGTLIIDHGHQLSSSFLHLHKILVKQGDRVEQGDVIAEVGATGRVTGAHLDWRMNLRSARIDPALRVPPMPER
ncbi:MAG: M23 family metallopeptidase [Gammaproteobacteria bacterium]|nr:M23 family metallopeptidase [Gammaproteobacteria bacterium]